VRGGVAERDRRTPGRLPLAPLGARPHWGKLSTLPREEVKASYPRADDFAGLLERIDPEGKFRNPFVDALFPRG
jgi:xylitol oxidase